VQQDATIQGLSKGCRPTGAEGQSFQTKSRYHKNINFKMQGDAGLFQRTTMKKILKLVFMSFLKTFRSFFKYFSVIL
jgi:hypothetical protein